MRKFNSHRVGVSQGSVVLFSDFQVGGTMWTGSGPRELRRSVVFPDTYLSDPVVHISMSMWDMDHKHNQRADISAEMITPEGFAIVFRTWGDTRVARVRADWMAIGEVKSEDDWTLD